MEIAHIEAVLKLASATYGDEGWREVAEGKTISFYVGHAGSTLNIQRTVAVRVDGPLVHARTSRGELYVVTLEDLFAGVVEGSAQSSRKAGFVGA